MSDIAIQFDNVGKLYKLGLVGTGTLSHDLNRWWKTTILRQEDPYLKIGETNDRSKKGSSDYVWALRDITFDVKQGDVVGIIGKNGAGKSTLLKLLSRITSPTTGAIRAKGRIASLLEVGTGFHPELTGRENIYMNGSIMGMTRHEIDRKLDEIVDFAGIERYIDTPVKRYSSGMTVRLGFAVAAFLEPEILVVDEVLAVGDAEFQKKAIGKMQDVSKGEGRTVLFVSHNMAAVKSLCTRGIVLENGKLAYDDIVEKAVAFYQTKCKINTNEIDLSKRAVNNKQIYIKDFTIYNHKKEMTNSLSFHENFNCTFTIKANESLNFTARVAVFDINENRILAFDSSDTGTIFTITSGEEQTIICQTEENLHIKPGHYRINISIRQGSNLLDHIVGATHFEIKEEDFFGFGRYSSIDMPSVLKQHKWLIQ